MKLSDYLKRLKKIGSSTPVTLIEDAQDIISIGNPEVKKLCTDFLNSDITCEELWYLADIMLMSEKFKFSSDKYYDYVSEMTDPTVNSEFTKERAKDILEELKILA